MAAEVDLHSDAERLLSMYIDGHCSSDPEIARSAGSTRSNPPKQSSQLYSQLHSSCEAEGARESLDTYLDGCWLSQWTSPCGECWTSRERKSVEGMIGRKVAPYGVMVTTHEQIPLPAYY